MYDSKKIVPGLVLFVAVVTMPFWWNLAIGAQPRSPEIAKPVGETRCIEDAATMRREHMHVLVSWRDDVVRSGDRVFVAADGRRFTKSLTGTCLRCHADTKASCDRCHDHLAVHPYCWECHAETKGER